MKTTEERIAELEQRVAYLEGIVNQSENIELKSLNINDSSLIHIEDSAEYHTENASKEMDSVQNSVFKDKEALLGRYIVGVLAAILIFVGAVSFVSLIWHRITPEGKVAIITLSGVALTALGFWLIRKNKNPVSSVILGMGAGLLFIAILSANMAFYLISNNTAIFLSGAWAIAFIMSSRYRDLFFTKIIAYIGSYITLILGLSLMSSNMELLVLTLFVTAISGVMFRTSKFNVKTDSVETDQPTINMERILNIILSMFSYTTIFAGSMLKWGIDGYGIQLGILSVIYVLLNMLYKVYDIRRKKYPLYLLISLFVTMLTI